ncbi:(2E,6E)-farnesyl diphosphate synthase [Aliagarivorans taiwanensis]|uniref:(2E,6E)-farnesyl diphosphate synthase n=1 Tax=Aliagarivorans taiwanensis TaxID=561966 RepID=UPI0004209DE9|nr:farnesyl diphosphate synthase [Aliagarivorans taiwanensis]
MHASLADALGAYQQRINDYLAEQLTRQPDLEPRLKSAMHHGLLLGGKRVRPALVYMVGELAGLELTYLDPVAAAVEAIHAYSLIHDDLPAMDDDELRRGQPTCHIAFDEATAILAGDALQSFAFEQLSQAPLNAELRIELVATLSKAAGYAGMVGGQALDMAATEQQVSLEALEQIHRHKTGALISAAVAMGAISADLPADQRAALLRYSQAIGLAFQVQDDILDLTSDTETLGKPQGSDAELQKSTYPALLGLDGARDKAQSLRAVALQALETLPYNSAMLAELADYIVYRDK